MSLEVLGCAKIDAQPLTSMTSAEADKESRQPYKLNASSVTSAKLTNDAGDEAALSGELAW